MSFKKKTQKQVNRENKRKERLRNKRAARRRLNSGNIQEEEENVTEDSSTAYYPDTEQFNFEDGYPVPKRRSLIGRWPEDLDDENVEYI